MQHQQQPLWMNATMTVADNNDEAESDEAVSDDEGIEGFNVSLVRHHHPPYYSKGFCRFCAYARSFSISNPLLLFLYMCAR